jgi:hypothetical protein
MTPHKIGTTAAIMTGCGFILFPFSYQAIAMIAAQFHLTLILGIMLCLWSALLWLDQRGETFTLVACWLSAFMAIFSHENGALIVPLLAGLIIAVYRRNLPDKRRLALVFIPITGIALLYALLWLSFRPQEQTELTSALDVSLAMLFQGLIYPIAALARPFIDGDIGAWELLLLVAVTIIAIILFVTAIYKKALYSVFYGLGWYVIAIIPSAVFLGAGYVLGQPRLALLASAGGAIFWGIAIAAIVHNLPKRFALPIIVICIIVAGYISFDFIDMRRAEFIRLRNYNEQALQLFDYANVADSGATLVNAPDFLIPPEEDRRFLLGTEGVLFVDGGLDYNQQFWLNSDVDYHNVDVIGYVAIQNNEGYGFVPHPPALDSESIVERVKNSPLVFVTEFIGGDFFPALVGGTTLGGADTPIVAFDGRDFALTEANAIYDPNTRVVESRLRWQSTQPAPVKIFIHVYCNDELIDQADGYPWGNTYPFSAWSPGETQTDIRRVYLDANIPADCMRVYAGLYYEQDGTRLEAINIATNERYADDRVPVEILVKDTEG